jgi:DHA1 family multidrug resistance protein B-like MFS transporter
LLVALSDVIAFLTTLFLITDDFNPASQPDSEGNKDSAIEKGGVMQSLFGLIKDRLFVMYFLAAFSLATISCQLTNYIAIHMTEVIPRQQLIDSLYLDGMNLLGLLQSENTLLVICFTFVVTFLVRKLSQRAAIIAGVVLFASGYVSMMIGTAPLLFCLAMLVTTIGELLYVPVGQNFLADLAPDDQRGLYTGIAGLSGSFGMISASLMITLVNILPSTVIVVIVSLFGILAAFFMLALIPESKKN